MLKNRLLLGLMLVFFVVAACSSNTGGSEGNAVPPAPEPAKEQENSNSEALPPSDEEDDEPAELVFYSVSRDSEEVFNDRFGDAIREAFPHYTIKYIQRVPEQTDLEQLLASGQQIDIIWDSLGSFPGSVLNYDLKMDMTPLIEKHELDLSRFEPILVDAMKQLGEGAIYGIPVEDSGTAVFYNKDLFDQFGVDYPRDGMTWEEMQALAKQLTVESDGVLYTGYSPSANHMLLQTPLSLALIDPETEKSTFHDERWKTVIETEILGFADHSVYKKAMEENKGRILGIDKFYKEKTLAMFPSGPLLPVVLKDEMSRMNWDIVSMPTYPERPGVGYQPYPIYFGITNQSENLDAAMKVIKFLTSDEFQMEISKKGIMTTLKNEEIRRALGTESVNKDKNWGAFFYNEPAEIGGKSIIDTKVAAIYPLTNRIPKVIRGEMDLNTALREAEEEVNQLIQEAMR